MKKPILSLTLIILTLMSCQKDDNLGETKSNLSEQSTNKNEGRICIEKFPPSYKSEKAQGSVLNQNKWAAGTYISVKFLNGDEFLHEKVRRFATEWSNFANIKFYFVGSSDNADIKINFDNSNSSWSYFGNYAQKIPQNQASMNFGWFNKSTPDAEFSRTIIHEFGHALCMVHEHQNPNVSIPWNKDAVYKYFSGAPNYWSKDKVDSNIFNTYSQNQTNSGNYDKASIMHYFFPDGLTTDGSTFTQNSVLSDNDKSFISQIYPPSSSNINNETSSN